MFLKLQSDKMLNMKYLQDAFQGFHDKNVVVIYLTNGNKFIEKYQSENDAKARIEEIRTAMQSGGGLSQKDSISDFPEKGSNGQIYIAKDTGQTYYWDSATETYVPTGTSGRTGIYSYNGDLPSQVGSLTQVNISELIEILEPSVEYMEGSEVVGRNNVHGIITKLNGNKVNVKTIVDLTIESFKQVATENDLPAQGSNNTLYFVEETDKLYSYNSEESKYVDYNSADQVDEKITEAISDIPSKPQVFCWEDQEKLAFWNEVMEANDETNVIVMWKASNMMSGSKGQMIWVSKEPGEIRTNKHIYGHTVGTGRPELKNNSCFEIELECYQSVGFTIENDVITSAGCVLYNNALDVLSTNFDYQNPYTPLYNGSPATKKYVDDTKGVLLQIIQNLAGRIEALERGYQEEFEKMNEILGVQDVDNKGLGGTEREALEKLDLILGTGYSQE